MTTTRLIRSLRLFFLAWAAMDYFGGIPAKGAVTGNRWLPRTNQLKTSGAGRDCSVYRAVLRRAEREAESHQKAIDSIHAVLKDRRETLEKCGAKRGLTSLRNDDEIKLAELCPEEYDAWTEPAYHLEIHNQDMGNSREAVETLQGELRYRCGELPQAKVETPPELLVEPIAH